MAKFKKKDASERKTVRRIIRLTTKEDEEIKLAASIRQLSVSEYIRRTALGRKADIRYEVEIVLAISTLMRTLRELHAAYTEGGATIPLEEWRLIREAAIAAMIRAGK